ncbi:MAG: sigma-70 family RNA polymerase sigma factor, partial [Lachnospiraceae bacterium]|nr:sigma-70 family RNA polymerase sigma factor [Lachnospiraceae bacterium]
MQKLARRASEGDDAACAELYGELQKNGIGLAMKYVRNHADAEDMFQDAFLKAMGALSSYDVNRAFQPWFDVILINTCKNHLTKKRPLNFSDLGSGEEEAASPADNIVSSDVSLQPEAVAERRAVKEIVGGMLNELPEAQREATVLFYYRELSVKQIAKVQQVSEDTVKSRLNYARKKVADAVEVYYRKHGVRLYTPMAASAAALVLFFRTGGAALLYGAGAVAAGG